MIRTISICSGLLLGASALAAAVPAGGAERFAFKETTLRTYRLADPGSRLLSVTQDDAWVAVVTDDRAAIPFKIGSRVVLQIKPGADLRAVLGKSTLSVVEEAAPGLYILQASDAFAAAIEAQRLAARPEVVTSHPEMKRPIKLHHEYAPRPNDPYFDRQWYLENRETNGTRLGTDVNARAGWPHQLGVGVPVAVVDSGVELTHPDLLAAVNAMPHYNFYYAITNAGPSSLDSAGAHGTAVAGLVAARGNNGLGVSGVAPQARIASWVIFETAANDVAGEGPLRDMFQYQSNTVPIQNHSWSFSSFQQLSPGVLQEVGISNAIHFGRAGKGVIMVRSAGNDRQLMANANNDGYTKNPRVITVGAVRKDGQVTSYSTPGACLLLAAPSGDTAQGFGDAWTTDLQGTAGANQAPSVTDANDYRFFSGTSTSSPLVAGIVALMLEANPALTYRDVQHILIHAARQTDPADPLIKTNQAGYRISPNVGFGVPDTGRAVRLALSWPLRAALTNLSFVHDEIHQIPNQGLRIETFGSGVPLQLASIIAVPGVGLHPEDLTPFYPLVDVGGATVPIVVDLTGKAALIRRGTNTFAEKINHAAAAGARLAIIANFPGDNNYVVNSGTYRAAIPALFIKGDDGVALREYVATNALTQVRSILFATTYTNHVNTALSLEHVGVRINTDHPYRGDLRITVTSPAGTRSLLQPVNEDFSGGPFDWTYWSTHHFYESSQGVWSIQISDEHRNTFGNCLYAELILEGVPITDSDRDGLDDAWELANFQNLAAGPSEDADDDGESNIAEFLQGTSPLTAPGPFLASVTQWSPDFLRIGWPANRNRNYQVLGATNVTSPFMVITNLPGSFDSGEWFTPTAPAWNQFFMIRSALP